MTNDFTTIPSSLPVESGPNSITGYTRDNLYATEDDVPAWLLEAEKLHGRMIRTTAMTLPGGRIIHVTRFASNWRWTLENPANPPGQMETDIWLTPEALEASELLIALLYGSDESRTAHLEGYIESTQLAILAKQEDADV